MQAVGSMVIFSCRSVGDSVSMDVSMSVSYSLKSLELEYIDRENISELKSVERKGMNSLYTTENQQVEGIIQKRDTMTGEEIVDIDNNLTDPQFCATIASDIYKYLFEPEVKRRYSIAFMERVQNDIDTRMRDVLIYCLVEVDEEFRLLPDTLHLTVNYVDRYLSGNAMKRQRLQLLGVACMMIASVGLVAHAKRLLHELKRPDNIPRETAITILAGAGRVEEVTWVFRQAFEAGEVKDTSVFGCMIELFSRNRKYANCIQVFENMRVAGYFPASLQ